MIDKNGSTKSQDIAGTENTVNNLGKPRESIVASSEIRWKIYLAFGLMGMKKHKKMCFFFNFNLFSYDG